MPNAKRRLKRAEDGRKRVAERDPKVKQKKTPITGPVRRSDVK